MELLLQLQAEQSRMPVARPPSLESTALGAATLAGLAEGSDPALKSETVVYSAHFDHDGVGPLGVLHGADDNGSGTVGVVEVARAATTQPVRQGIRIGIVGEALWVNHDDRLPSLAVEPPSSIPPCNRRGMGYRSGRPDPCRRR